MNDSEDLSQNYQTKVAAASPDVAEMERFISTAQQSPDAAAAPQPQGGDPSRPLPPPKPLRQPSDDSIGRIPVDNKQAASGVSRNLAEVPSAAIGGVESAIKNSVGWAIDPLANWLNDNVADLSYNRDIKTPTGKAVQGITEFLTGFVPALKGLRAAGVTGKVIAPMAAGAVADFAARDPSSGRLADLWKQFDLPNNVLTDYLASKPGDSEVEARFKNAVEGLGLGVFTEGVIRGAGMIRAARQVKGAAETERAYLREKYGELSDETYNKVVGDPSKPSVEMIVHQPGPQAGKIAQGAEDTANLAPRSVIRMKAAPVIKTDAEGNVVSKIQPEDFDVYINFAKFDEPDQVKFAIGKMAEAAKGSIDEATRGVITHVETEKLAGDLGMSVTDLLARRQGQPLNAEEALAARQLWAASGERVVALAKTAAAKDAGALDQFAFRKQLAVHAAIQSEVIGARAETARALNAWKIPAKGDVDRARALDQIMQAMGGPEQSAEMARRIAILSEVGADPSALAKFAEKGATASTLDAVKEAWINGLLSSPKTHAVNIMSNTLVAFNSIVERQVAAGIRGITGGDGVQAIEGAASAFGLVQSVRDAWVMAAKALKTGETSWSFNKMDLAPDHNITPEAFGMSRETGLGRFVDYLGTATRVPTRLLGAEDEFFKTIGYRMELYAQAARTAKQEGLTGYNLGRRVAEIVQNPPEHIMINSADSALYQTFTNEVGNFGRSVMNLRNNVPAVTFVLPFIRTPVNIARYAFERTPFAPLVGQWRADIAAGGARSDLALARMATGTSVMLTMMDLADKGVVSGAGDRGGKETQVTEAMQRQGWQPYSVKVGNSWYSYNRADPFGMTMGFAASIAEAVRRGEVSQDEVDEWQEVSAMAIAAVSQVAISKTYLEGVSKFIEVLQDPQRYAKQYINDLFASFVPATSLNAGIKNIVDPTQRDAETPAQAVMARIAGLSDNLPPKRDLWGKPMTNESGLGSYYDFLSPIGVKPETPSPIDREMVRMHHGVERISKQTNFDGVQANMRFYPKAYDDYVKLAGNDLKHPAWGMGAHDFLDSVVSGKSPMSTVYNMMSDQSRQSFIESTIQEYRKLAQRQIMSDPKHANFTAEIQKLKGAQTTARMPVLN